MTSSQSYRGCNNVAVSCRESSVLEALCYWGITFGTYIISLKISLNFCPFFQYLTLQNVIWGNPKTQNIALWDIFRNQVPVLTSFKEISVLKKNLGHIRKTNTIPTVYKQHLVSSNFLEKKKRKGNGSWKSHNWNLWYSHILRKTLILYVFVFFCFFFHFPARFWMHERF